MRVAHPAVPDRAAAVERWRAIRARSRALFDLLEERVYFDRPIALRNPVVFYEGHLPVFAVNTLIRRALGRRGIDEELETIFARGIDPDTEADAVARGNPAWPDRARVRAYARAAEALVEDAIVRADLDVPGHPLLDRAQALWTILEHEEMHQETLAYMWHEVPYAAKRVPDGYRTLAAAAAPVADPPRRIRIPRGIVTLGTDLDTAGFGWDNELPAHRVEVPAFAIDVHNVTNEQFMAFVDAGGYADARWWKPDDWRWVRGSGITCPHFWQRVDGEWYWRGMFERVPLPSSWPVYVTAAEAAAYARWSGARLPTEAEFHRAAFGTPEGAERLHAWRPVEGGGIPANLDFARWDPEPVGSRPFNVSAFGVYDLVGNGWEWTSTVFAPFDGFTPMASYPEYSADFFDGDHVVLKGGSPVTARALTRRGFRNWFRPHYPYVYATFRCIGPE